MIHILNNRYAADEGKILVSKNNIENVIGEWICIGTEDSIDNYIEIDSPESNTDDKTKEE